MSIKHNTVYEMKLSLTFLKPLNVKPLKTSFENPYMFGLKNYKSTISSVPKYKKTS